MPKFSESLNPTSWFYHNLWKFCRLSSPSSLGYKWKKNI